MTFTYLVKHEDGKEPTVTSDMEVHGGKVVAVAFGDEFARIEELESVKEKAVRIIGLFDANYLRGHADGGRVIHAIKELRESLAKKEAV